MCRSLQSLRDFALHLLNKIQIADRDRSLGVAFRRQKCRSKRLTNAFYANLRRQIEDLPWSDP